MFRSGSNVLVTQQLPPPRCQASPSSGQVSDPGSPGLGTMYVRHTRSPFSRLNASRWPRLPNSPPELPTMTMSLTISGATVALSPARTSPKVWSQTFLPVAASSAITWAASVVTKTLPSATATPRLTLPQHSDTSNAAAVLYCQRMFPVWASSAQTQPSHPETYMMPSTTSGEASNEYVDLPECRPTEPHWKTQAGVSCLMVSLLIWSSGL